MSPQRMQPTVQDLSDRELGALLYDIAHEIDQLETSSAENAGAILEARRRLLERKPVGVGVPRGETPQ